MKRRFWNSKDPSYMKLVGHLRSALWRIQEMFEIIENRDKILVCMSGDKDSYTMLDIPANVQNSGKLDFELIAVNLDQKQPVFWREA